ncbi:ATP-dependent sacrificial sulfur transferase LarE [Methanorbis rubei]|uniref:Pyridinium-3,5-bisthiocarboxylic acid mononucleotide synthase n=1 Tax=Methanorbis rubei TaxID=3028300 RepID=A0AAE4MEZ7_9EURY|nr:Pyridinium-3,5-bisthiocarboxylic acid mononucleotide synthase [Methanocorpusculaceae archaeon Cs1]
MKTVLSKLSVILKKHSPMMIALSGGQDSLTLLAAAKAAGIPVVVATVISEFEVPGEAERAKEFCRILQVQWYPVHVRILEDAAIAANPIDRCYLCKKKIMGPLVEVAKVHGYNVCDGTHADDVPEERPGSAALQELEIRSPFVEAGIGKEQIMSLAKELSVPVIPPSSCLATRIPFGTVITEENLRRVAAAETFLHEQGVTGILRVRMIGDEAVVEVEAGEMQLASKHAVNLEQFGFSRVRVAGYISGGVTRWKQTQQ